MPGIDQTSILKQILTFLKAIGENPPAWAWENDRKNSIKPMCHAFKVMVMRSSFSDEEENDFYSRLETLSQTSDAEISKMSTLYKEFQTELKRLLMTHYDDLQKKLIECKEDASKKQIIRDQHVKLIREKAYAKFDEDQAGYIRQAEDFYIFTQSLFAIDNLGSNYSFLGKSGIIPQDEFESILTLLPTDKILQKDQKSNFKHPRKVYSFSFAYKGHTNELEDVIKQIIQKDNRASICTSDHSMYIRMIDTNKYIIYDSNGTNRPEIISLDQLIKKIKSGFFTDFKDQIEYIPLRIQIYSHHEIEEKRPTPAALFHSIIQKRKDTKIEKDLKDYLPELTRFDFDHTTASIIAAYKYETKEKDLLELNKQGFDQSTSLNVAATSGEYELVEQLLLNKANINIKDRNNHTPLFNAIHNGHEEVVKILLKHNAAIEPDDVLEAAGRGNPNIVAMVLAKLKKDKIEINKMVNADQDTALIYAVSQTHLSIKAYRSIVKKLIAAGANVNATNKNGLTPLELAANRNDKLMIGILLKAGARTNILDSTGVRISQYVKNKPSSDTKELTDDKESPVQNRKSDLSNETPAGRMLFLSKLNNYLFADWANVEKHRAKNLSEKKSEEVKIEAKKPPVESKELIIKKTTEAKEKIAKFFNDYKPGSKLKDAILSIQNTHLEDILYGTQTKPTSSSDFFNDAAIEASLMRLDRTHKLLGDEKNQIPPTTKKLFNRVFKLCKIIADSFEKNNDEKDEVALVHAYKMIVLFGHDLKNPLTLFSLVDEFLEKNDYYSKTDKPIHDVLMPALPAIDKNKIHLKEWQILIREGGDQIIKLFNKAEAIEKYLGGRCPKNLEEAQDASKCIHFERAIENPELAKLFVKYNFNNAIFNRALEVLKSIKKKDNLPDVHISSLDFKDDADNAAICEGYHLVKLPINDLNAFVLGALTNCCQSMGGVSEQCVIDGLTLENNGFYVLLKNTSNIPNKPHIIDGKINYQHFNIVGQGYAWFSKAGNLVLDSWENLTPERDDKVIAPLLKKFAQKITQPDDSPILRVNIGIGGKTPKLFGQALNEPLEDIKQGFQYGDSKNQYQIHKNDNRHKKYLDDLDKLILESKSIHDEKNDKTLKNNLSSWFQYHCQSPYTYEIAKQILSPRNLDEFLPICNQFGDKILRIPIDAMNELLEYKLFDTANLKLLAIQNSQATARKISKCLITIQDATFEIDNPIRHSISCYFPCFHPDPTFFINVLSKLRQEKEFNPYVRHACLLLFSDTYYKKPIKDIIDNVKVAIDILDKNQLKEFPSVLQVVFQSSYENIKENANFIVERLSVIKTLVAQYPILLNNADICKFCLRNSPRILSNIIDILTANGLLFNLDVWLKICNENKHSLERFSKQVAYIYKHLNDTTLIENENLWDILFKKTEYLADYKLTEVITLLNALKENNLNNERILIYVFDDNNLYKTTDKLKSIIKSYTNLKEEKLENDPIIFDRLIYSASLNPSDTIMRYKPLKVAGLHLDKEVLDYSLSEKTFPITDIINAFQALAEEKLDKDPDVRRQILQRNFISYKHIELNHLQITAIKIIAALNAIKLSNLHQNIKIRQAVIKNPDPKFIEALQQSLSMIKDAKLDHISSIKTKLLDKNYGLGILTDAKSIIDSVNALKEAKLDQDSDLLNKTIDFGPLSRFDQTLLLIRFAVEGYLNDPEIKSVLLKIQFDFMVTDLLTNLKLFYQSDVKNDIELKNHLLAVARSQDSIKSMRIKYIIDSLSRFKKANLDKDPLIRSRVINSKDDIDANIVCQIFDIINQWNLLGDDFLRTKILYLQSYTIRKVLEGLLKGSETLKNKKLIPTDFIIKHFKEFPENIDEICVAYVKLNNAGLEKHPLILSHKFTEYSFAHIDLMIANIQLIQRSGLEGHTLLQNTAQKCLEEKGAIYDRAEIITKLKKANLDTHPLVCLRHDALSNDYIAKVIHTVQIFNDEKLPMTPRVIKGLTEDPFYIVEDSKTIISLLKKHNLIANQDVCNELFRYPRIAEDRLPSIQKGLRILKETGLDQFPDVCRDVIYTDWHGAPDKAVKYEKLANIRIFIHELSQAFNINTKVPDCKHSFFASEHNSIALKFCDELNGILRANIDQLYEQVVFQIFYRLQGLQKQLSDEKHLSLLAKFNDFLNKKQINFDTMDLGKLSNTKFYPRRNISQ